MAVSCSWSVPQSRDDPQLEPAVPLGSQMDELAIARISPTRVDQAARWSNTL